MTQAKEWLQEGDYEGFLALFDSHKRLRGFIAIEPALKGGEYWKALAYVWTHVESTHQNRSLWLRLLGSRRRDRHMIMTKGERSALAKMPKELRLYRGFNQKGGENGFSWTLDRKRAVFFAEYARRWRRGRYAGIKPGAPRIASGLCYKSA